MFNVFNDAAVPLLFYNLEEDLWPCIKSFLVFLNRIPEFPKSILSNHRQAVSDSKKIGFPIVIKINSKKINFGK